MKPNKLTFSKKEVAEIKKASTDAETQGVSAPSQSVEAFSVADIPFTENGLSVSEEFLKKHEDSKWKMALYLETMRVTYGGTPGARAMIFEEAQKLNEKEFNPKISTDEIIDLYTSIVIHRKSYTKNDLMIETLEDKNALTASLSFQDLMQQSFPKARYTIEPFFEQGTVNMISAPPNNWKSWLLFYFSAHISGGTKPFDKFEVEQSKVMIVNEEDSFRSIQDRFNILNITDTSLPIFFRVANGSKLESKFINKLLEEIKEKEIKVVIFDSLRSMHEADENDSTAMQKILDQMKRISREGVTVIFTHHHRKKGMFEKQSSAESSRGSSAINAAISGHISLDEEERETGLFLVIRHLKSKAGEKLPAFEVKITKNNNKVEFTYDGEFKASEKKLKQTKEQIMDILADGKWKNVKEFEGIETGKTVMRQALQSLKNDGVILSIDRKTAISKSIPVSLRGNAREFYYSLNTESAEMVTRHDEEATDQAFNDF